MKYKLKQVRAFLKEPAPRAEWKKSIQLGQPPVAGVSKLVEERFGKLTKGGLTTTGKALRQEAVADGHPHQKYGVPIKMPGCQFKSGSTYRLVSH